jgi:hypothetical protein
MNYDELHEGLAKEFGASFHDAYRGMLDDVEKQNPAVVSLDYLARSFLKHGVDATVGALLAHVYEEFEMHRILNASEKQIDAELRAMGIDPETAVAKVQASIQEALRETAFLRKDKKAIRDRIIKNE